MSDSLLQIPTGGLHAPVGCIPGILITQVTGRTWRGSAFGGVKGRTEIPGLVEGKFY
jgi:Zn-dependent alcohol dehydrogenase